MRKLFTALFFLCCVPVLLYGQPTGGGAQNVYEASMPDIIHPSPQAMTFMRYGEIPVSLSSGVPEISIPIYSFKANGMEFPISISYHASGIRVQDIAGTVGLGWVLNAGGMIAQTVYGWNDNHSQNYNYHKLSELPFNSASGLNGANKVINNERDSLEISKNIRRWWYGCFNDLSKFIMKTDETGNTISDRYSFNFCGQTGVFRYDLASNNYETAAYKTIPHSPLKVEKSGDEWNADFIITDENGIKWIFGLWSHVNMIISGSTLNTAPQEFYLKTVKFPGTNDSIRLMYDHGIPYDSESYSESVFNGEEPSYTVSGIMYFYTGSNYHINKRTRSESAVKSFPILLQSITWRNEHISFSYDSESGDLIKNRLTHITMYSDNSKIKEVTLHQGLGERMYLDSIKINEEKYAFEYNKNLPSREGIANSYSDFWGYPNGSNTNKRVPYEWSTTSPATYKRTYLGFRESNSAYAGAGMLVKITYPTKGSTVFEYESNQGDDIYTALSNSTVPSQNEPFGGSRIKRISNYDGLGSLSWKTYEYEGGITVKPEPRHFIQNPTFRYLVTDNFSLFDLPDPSLAVQQVEIGVTGTEFPLTEYGGQLAFYHKVTEYTGKDSISEGKVEYFYTRKVFNSASINPLLDFDHGSIPPLLVKKEEYSYNNGSYSLKRETKNHYSTAVKGSFIFGVNVSHGYVFSPNLLHLHDIDNVDKLKGLHSEYYYGGGGFAFRDMKGIRDYMRLDNTEIIEYYDSQDTFSTKISYYYNYDSRLLTPNVTITENSTGKRYIESITYPFDYKTLSPYNDMVSKNIFSPVVSRTAKMDYLAPAGPMGAPPVTQDTLPVINMFDGQQMATIRYHYGEKQGGLYVIDSVAAAKGDTLLETRIRYHNYDKYGNPLYITKDSSIHVVYLWSYKGKYPVAEIKNATNLQVAALFPIGFIDTLSDTIPDANRMNTVENALRNASSLSNAQVTTFYYKQGVGVSQIIDPNGMKITYEYDAVGRLQAIRDDDGNILEHHSYHYAQ